MRDTAGTSHATIALAGDVMLGRRAAEARRGAERVILALHWGPNLHVRPTPPFRRFARRAVEAGADVVWGHSAPIVQGIEIHRGRPIPYDTGDVVDDCAVDPALRNDLSMLFTVRVAGGASPRIDRVTLQPVPTARMRVDRAAGLDRDGIVRRVAEPSADTRTRLVDEGDAAAVPVGAGT